MKEKMVKKAKKVIKDFAKKYGLRYNSKWFQCIFLPYEECLIKKFLSGGPIGDYDFDKPEKRFKDLDKFLKSGFFRWMKKEKKGQGNLVKIDRFRKEIKEMNKIENLRLRKKVKFIYEKIEKKFKDDYLVILPNVCSHDLQILTHEWMHVLLNKNPDIEKKKRGYDWFNEGLATFAEYLVSDEKDKIKKDIERIRLSRVRYMYLKYALKWKEKLEKSKEKGIIEKTFKTRKI
jgi:hypothetical protein